MLQIQHTVQSTDSSFEAMAAGTKRKYIMISGKGGVGKTSLAALLAVKFAAAGHTTLVVSTDPAHSLSDSLDQVRFCSCSVGCPLMQLSSHATIMYVHHIVNCNLDLPSWYRGMVQYEDQMIVYTFECHSVMCYDVLKWSSAVKVWYAGHQWRATSAAGGH